MSQIAVGVVGVGNMGLHHVEAYRRTPRATVEAVADVDEARTRELAQRLGAQAFTDARQMLERTGVQAVSICTNDERHVEPALACFEAGRPVLLEKPVATTLADADRIIGAAEGAGTTLLIGHIVRFDPRYADVQRRAEAGEFGTIEAVFARRLNQVRSQQVLRGRVSVLSFLGVHDFDYLCWLCGRPVHLHTESVAGVHRAAGYNIEDHTYTLVRFESGAIACVEVGWLLPDTHPCVADIRLDVTGSRGTAAIDLIPRDYILCGQHGWQMPMLRHALDEQIDHFLDCVEGTATPRITGADGRLALAMSLAAQRSAAEGRIVTPGGDE